MTCRHQLVGFSWILTSSDRLHLVPGVVNSGQWSSYIVVN